MIMNLFGSFMAPPANAPGTADSGASSNSNAASNEEYEQFMRNFAQGFQAGMNASSNFQAQSQASAESSNVPAVVSFLFGRSSGIMFLFSGTCFLASLLSPIDRSGLAAVPRRALHHRSARGAAPSVRLFPGDAGAGGCAEQRSFVCGMDSDAAERDFAVASGGLARGLDRRSVLLSAEILRFSLANGRFRGES